MNSYEMIIDYHKKSLETCKQLFREKRYVECRAIIKLLDKNIEVLIND